MSNYYTMQEEINMMIEYGDFTSKIIDIGMMIMTNSGEGWMMNMVSYKEIMAKGLIT